MSSFKNSIGGSHGSGNINTTSVNRSQASGNAVGGYGSPTKGASEFARGRTLGAGPKAPSPPVRPNKAHNEAAYLKKGGVKPPNGGRM